MSTKTVWLLIISGLGVGAAFSSEALAPVESRRGSSATSYSYANPEGDRATRLLMQIEALKQEVSDLRGLVEVQDHEIKQLRKSQQDLYLDLDKRLVQVQQAQKGSPASGKPVSLAKEKQKPEVRASIPKTPGGKPSSSGGQSAGATPPIPVITGIPNRDRGADSAKLPLPSAQASNKSSAEKGTYELAYSLVRSKRYAEAITALQDYLARFPEGEQAPNAYYWLGEVYIVQWQANKSNTGLLDKASQAFLKLREEFPMHAKSTDALLKLGLIESDKGNFESARHYLTEVTNRYPGTSAARIAETRLQQLM